MEKTIEQIPYQFTKQGYIKRLEQRIKGQEEIIEDKQQEIKRRQETINNKMEEIGKIKKEIEDIQELIKEEEETPIIEKLAREYNQYTLKLENEECLTTHTKNTVCNRLWDKQEKIKYQIEEILKGDKNG